MKTWTRQSYTHQPREVSTRTSSWHFFENEACYQKAEFRQRDLILKHRAAAGFTPELRSTSHPFFDSDPKVAFENINEGSLIFSARYKPRRAPKMEDFKARSFPHGDSSWSTLNRLRIEIAEFLLMRNHNIAKSRPEHLNDPINFLFLDIKQMIERMATNFNTESTLSSVQSLVTYINNVNAALTRFEHTDRDRLFLDQVKDFLRQDVKSQINFYVENASIRAKLKSLIGELSHLTDSVTTDLHFSLGDKLVARHALPLGESVAESDRSQFPVHALMHCARQMIEASTELAEASHTSLPLAAIKDNPFYKLSDDHMLEADPALVDHCAEVQLLADVTTEDKKLYVSTMGHLSNLLSFINLLSDVTQAFEQAGQVQMIMAYQHDIADFLRALNLEITATQSDIESLIERNHQLEVGFLHQRLEATALSKSIKHLTGMIGFSYTDIEQFIENKAHRHGLRTPAEQMDPSSSFEQSKQTTKAILDKLDQLTTSRPKIASSTKAAVADKSFSDAVKTLKDNAVELYLPHEEQAQQAFPSTTKPTASDSKDFSIDCNLAIDKDKQAPVLHCASAGEYEVFVYPLQSIPDGAPAVQPYSGESTYSEQKLTGDFYDSSSCRPISFYNSEFVICDGEKTSMFYRPLKQNSAETFFSQIDGQIALGFVLFKMAQNTYQWFVTPAEEKTLKPALSEEAAAAFIESSYKSIATIKSRGQDEKWVGNRVDELIKLISDYQSASAITVSEAKEFEEDLQYCLDSVTKVESAELKIEKARTQTQLEKKSTLNQDEIETATSYFTQVSQQLKNEFINIDESLLAEFKAIQQRYQMPIETLYEIADAARYIKALSHEPRSVTKTDLQYITETIAKLEIKGDSPKPTPLEHDISYLKALGFNGFAIAPEGSAMSSSLRNHASHTLFFELAADCRPAKALPLQPTLPTIAPPTSSVAF